MPLYLCCDCGGSKTSAVIVDAAGTVVGRALAGPSNFAYLSLEEFLAAVSTAVSNALKTCTTPASVDPIPLPLTEETFAAAWFGVSGVDSPAAIATITPALGRVLNLPLGPRLVVANDTHLLAAPVRMHKEIVHAVSIIGGTGAIAVSFKEAESGLEELGRVGGWGWILGDEGGGFHVGREAVRQMLVEHDRASVASEPPRHSPLKDNILKAFGVNDVLEVLTEVHVAAAPSTKLDVAPHLLMPREKRLSTLSPLVFDAAFSKRDPFALDVLKICAGLLAEQVLMLLGRRTDSSPRLVDASEAVACFGGSLVAIEGYRNLVLKHLEEKGQVFKYVEVIDDAAAIGARGLAASFEK
ncbi:hypothetical protein CYLTODRAFT_421935 [Cylindrobasidium torrendii FP15055 ss-10]|uniref:N-acetyl-D-glucosamine kinase n=1 Tax=Cylindrobasidium torrendii FP15055 ss-10 TaxID=1314674 RepID=A0A0D7BC12_9AGAR|nr:hypothetical protein CYLTODRAFT_421935 [Cylindrobasidium torrendii FP15055 ss-10]